MWRQLAACLGHRTYFRDLHPHLIQLVTVVPTHPLAEVAGKAIVEISIEAGVAICLCQVRRGFNFLYYFYLFCLLVYLCLHSLLSLTRMNVHNCWVLFWGLLGCFRGKVCVLRSYCRVPFKHLVLGQTKQSDVYHDYVVRLQNMFQLRYVVQNEIIKK